MTAAAGGTGEVRSGGYGRIAIALLVLGLAAVAYLTTRATPTPPFSIHSSAPDGYRALALLAEGYGATVEQVHPSDLRVNGSDRADTVVVPRPSRLSDEEQAALDDLAARGVTVVLGERVEPDVVEGFSFPGMELSDRELAEVPAMPTPRGDCDVPELVDLGPVDVAFAGPLQVHSGERSCYGDGSFALVAVREVGDGRFVTLSDPYLWANARLHPAKEEGGEPLDNAAMALRLTVRTEAARLSFVDPSAGVTTAADGTRGPLELLPLPVQLALLQGVVALLLFLWWRGRRLGRPVAEPLPVEIAASELVDAVGDLLRRRGSTQRAAAAMRYDTRRALHAGLGVPLGAPPGALVEAVAARTGRDVQHVAAVLLDPSPTGDEDLVHLAQQLDTIRQEALDDQHVR